MKKPGSLARERLQAKGKPAPQRTTLQQITLATSSLFSQMEGARSCLPRTPRGSQINKAGSAGTLAPTWPRCGHRTSSSSRNTGPFFPAPGLKGACCVQTGFNTGPMGGCGGPQQHHACWASAGLSKGVCVWWDRAQGRGQPQRTRNHGKGTLAAEDMGKRWSSPRAGLPHVNGTPLMGYHYMWGRNRENYATFPPAQPEVHQSSLR